MSRTAAAPTSRTSSAVSASKPGSFEQRAQHPQHLPAGPRFAQRRHDALEALHAALRLLTNVPAVSVKGAMGSRTSAYAVPCRNGLITTTSRPSPARRARRRHWRNRVRARRADEIRLARIREHRRARSCRRACGSACARCAPTVFAASVRKPSVAPVSPRAAARARAICDASACCIARLPSRIADFFPDRRLAAIALAASVAPCPRAQRGTDLPAAAPPRPRCLRAPPAAATARRSTLCATRSSQSSSTECSIEPARLLRGLPQPLRDQRMVLAQEAADDQHAIERIEFGDGHAEPGRAAGGRRRGNRFAAGGNRCCRCPARA